MLICGDSSAAESGGGYPRVWGSGPTAPFTATASGRYALVNGLITDRKAAGKAFAKRPLYFNQQRPY